LENGTHIWGNSAQLFGEFQHSCLANFGTVVWRISAQWFVKNSAQLFVKIQHSCLAKFSSFRVGETEQQFFCQALCVGNFLLSAESLMKSTPVVDPLKLSFSSSFFLFFS